jgi:hypothetical protein
MMDDQDQKFVGRKDISDYSGGWGIPALLVAVVFIAGVVFFSAAGPHRTRTAAYNNPGSKPASSQQSPAGDARAPAAKIPNADMPRAP